MLSVDPGTREALIVVAVVIFMSLGWKRVYLKNRFKRLAIKQ